MARTKGALLSIAAAALFCATAHAQIGGRPIEISGAGGIYTPDARARVKTGPAYTATIGWRVLPQFSIDGSALWAPSESDERQADVNFSAFGLDARYDVRPADGHMVPYFVGGFALGTSHTGGITPAALQRGTPSLGLGVLVNAFHQRSYLKFEVRDVLFREREQDEFGSNIAATAGLVLVIGGKEKDQDLDGVRDWLDKCPNTPLGAKVDPQGCPIDTDGDSVYDGIDTCLATPKGCTVDKNGCPVDADGDGVCDGLDKCADTPRGATVDTTGCPNDTDGDGVLDGIDRCDNTPKGATVDATGCVVDSDMDGVPDGIDLCPGTPPALRVDPRGCPIEVIERETELLDTGIIRLENAQFETGKAVIDTAFYPRLDVLGQLLKNWPQLRVEIGGHTDSKGSAASNQKLSEARAKAVVDYLNQKFPELPAGQLTAKGYGESQPIAPNTTKEGMAMNRRMELKVINKEVLRKELERRNVIQKSAAPPDTTQQK